LSDVTACDASVAAKQVCEHQRPCRRTIHFAFRSLLPRATSAPPTELADAVRPFGQPASWQKHCAWKVSRVAIRFGDLAVFDVRGDAAAGSFSKRVAFRRKYFP
jgi:hypothetical protein